MKIDVTSYRFDVTCVLQIISFQMELSIQIDLGIGSETKPVVLLMFRVFVLENLLQCFLPLKLWVLEKLG